MSDKLWGGRFTAKAAEWVDEFGASIHFDQKMAAEDIEGSIAHAKMLGKQGIISPEESEKIVAGLKIINEELIAGKIEFDVENEDIHMNIESLLTEKIGPVAGKLHTARSRNDQVATDFHLWVKHRLPHVLESLTELQEELLTLATTHAGTIMSGYTHLQHAQPITYGHYLLAYFEMFQRDYERFEFNQKHTDILPLGAAALAGTTFPIDREFVASELGFDSIYHNSLDAVSDRDFALEFLSNAAILMMHLSRMAEELILWSTYEFNYIELSDDFSTGSSIMPQKKNADFAELVRGKTGRSYGALMGLLTTMKSLPLAYNKDMQEDKEQVFDIMDTVLASVKVFTGMLSGLTVHKERMLATTQDDFSNATELADYLATKGVPFREAHAIVGQLVLTGIQSKMPLQKMSLSDLQAVAPQIEEDIYDKLQSETAVNRRTSLGGTAVENVKKEIVRNKKVLEAR
ncbi:argininosuccinate lyase [Leuconostoc mesenteroides]|uniref:argininosuccinate lyase n=1 Tax=Leuconostoc mesenteroides TaxID=1245 RepID=UPI000682A7B1|nr:argininosuccinate lyase [Leuconostoc mesenteroides]ARR89488.1 argininosuccinate lyase [Leuconostoc mesenteroides subsp. mesenteroides]KMY79085.1 argininosuccinate lyase [Leuconostoc mesenteroides subsp. cremoris]MCT3050818.1 argininosuccinate lyase [Leuconostoc mesenteroides]ORI77776.1 argininosuccinate lyase [Leuconostoc mesenteroides subsp. mesenteroides]TLP96094.1 argininosuccinate lyase [Leuconostoc mesenteroides]